MNKTFWSFVCCLPSGWFISTILLHSNIFLPSLLQLLCLLFTFFFACLLFSFLLAILFDANWLNLSKMKKQSQLLGCKISKREVSWTSSSWGHFWKVLVWKMGRTTDTNVKRKNRCKKTELNKKMYYNLRIKHVTKPETQRAMDIL